MRLFAPRLTHLALLLTSHLLASGLFAQQQASYTFSHIGIENGLSNSFILWAAEDSSGAIWLSTEAGINRITGDGCTTFTSDEFDIPGNMATTIFYDKADNQMWLFTPGGLSVVDCATLEVSRHPEEHLFHSKYVISAAESSDGGIWMGFKDGVIQHSDRKGGYTTYSPAEIDGLDTCPIRYLFDDGLSRLFIGYNNNGMGVLDYSKHSARHHFHHDDNPSSLPGNNVRIFVADQFHNIWVGTNRGLALYDPLSGNFTVCSKENGFPSDTSGDNVMGLCLMDDGRLWMSSEPGGVTILDLNGFATSDPAKVSMQYLRPSNSRLSSPYPRSIVQDRYGNIWICHYGTGIDVIEGDEPPFHIVRESPAGNDNAPDSPPLRFAYGISADSHQTVWIGGSSMLYRVQDNRITGQWSLKPFLNRAFGKTYITYCDSHDNVWIGIDDVGALRFNTATDKFCKITLQDDFIDVHAFLEDSQGRMWIGTEIGVHLCQGDTALLASTLIQPNQNMVIYALQEDAQGRIWVGTFGSGIFIYNNDLSLYEHLTIENGLCNNNINQIYKDSEGSFWIASRSGLVFIEDTSTPTRTRIFGKENGLADHHIRAVCQDQLGSIWVSTHTTISCLFPASGRFSNYDYHNGLPHGGFIESSACATADGTLYFASPNGICYFNPRLISKDSKVTPIRINAIETDENYHRFSFSVANYAQRNLVEYAYQMKGLNDEWHNTLGDTRVTFRDLRPGHYTFQVKARLRGGDWDDNSMAETSFYIAPPFYLSWWAILGYIIGIIGITGVIIYYYLHKVKLETYLKAEEKQREDERQLNDERMRFYTNITHELRTPLTLILGPLEDLATDTKLAEPYHRRLKTIHDSALRLLDLINQILEFRKAETQNRQLSVSKADLRKVVKEVGLRYEELNRNPQVNVCVIVPPQFPNIYFDREVVTTILNNLLSNALKYTDKGTITLSLETANSDGIEYAEIKVADTGYGIPPEALPRIFDRYYQADGKHQASGSGIGLSIVKSLAMLHEGNIEAESIIDKGSCFTFRIRMDNSYPNALHKEGADTKPVSTLPVTAKDENTVESDHEQRPVLLVVEDNDDIRQYILESLDLDYQVLTASNGKDGVELALQHIPDVIVSDIMMPIMDGIELCKAIKGDIRTSHIPIILLTAKDTISDKEEGYDSGADSYLTKPFSAKLLQSRIQNLLASRRRLAELLKRSSDAASASVSHPTFEAAPGSTLQAPGSSISEPALNPLDQQFIEKLNGIINENLSSESLDIAFLTEKMYMSSSTLYRKVKALIGVSPNEYIRHLRLQAARQMLLEGEHNISETAYLTGFSSPNYFRDCFKTEYGMSPTEFIRSEGTSKSS